jgi:malonyl-CoA O-methyltransferase
MSAVSGPDKAEVRRSFGAASVSYDHVAALQRSVGERLLARHLSETLAGTVVDLGCGTGFLTSRLARHPGDKQLLALDLALPMLQAARAKLSGGALYVGADAECLPLRDRSVDWLFSNLALQWCADLPALCGELRRVLQPGGRLAFSTFGPQTLCELKAAWAQADDYPHVNEFFSPQTLHGALQQAGFRQVAVAAQLCVNRYESPLALMRELKCLGAHNAVTGRKRGITTRTQLRNMTAAYEQLRGEGGLPASFEVFYVTAA